MNKAWTCCGLLLAAGCFGRLPGGEETGPGAGVQGGPWKDFDLRALGALCGVTQEGELDCPRLEQAGVELPEGDFQSVALTGGTGLAGCGLRTSGELACFDATAGSRLVSEVPSGRFVALAGHSLIDAHACAVDEGGLVHCWGEGVDELPPEDTFQGVLSSWDNTFCGLRPDRTLTCWTSSPTGSDEVTRAVPEGAWDAVSVGKDYACAMAGTSVTCWGELPEDDLPDEGLLQVGTGDWNVCGVRTEGTARCWGSNGYGQLGVPDGEFIKVQPVREQVCGLRPEGELSCWGLALF
jgi:hypothetical protein